MYHDKGCHLPYGFLPAEYAPPEEGYDSMRAFFEAHDDEDDLRDLYRDSVRRVERRFEDVWDTLIERGVLDDTLVVFTSDHGELLGEYGGLYGHSTPLVPEVVRVPTVFCGAGLPEGERLDTLVSGVDIVPTAFSATGRKVPSLVDGVDLWMSVPDRRGARSEVWIGEDTPWYKGSYVASSLWSPDGGTVVHRKRLLHVQKSLLGYVGKYAPLLRKRLPWNVPSVLKQYATRTRTHGEPDWSTAEILEDLSVPFESDTQIDPTIRPDDEQLRQLGYL